MRFTSGMSKDELIERFDKFHEQITGNFAYEDPYNNEWSKFRIGLIIACHRVLIDDDGWKKEWRKEDV